MNEITAYLTDNDIRFIVETVDANLRDKFDIIKSDPEIIEKMLDAECDKLYQRIAEIGRETILTQITPRLLFEILLRKAAREIGEKLYIMERTATQKIPVFDTREVAAFMSDKAIVRYLADMLDSFTRIESFTIPVRIRKGIWHKIRYSDIDFSSLVRMCHTVDEEHRFRFYKRIADLCLFILGMFPEYVVRNLGDNPVPEKVFPRLFREEIDYEEEGRRFYRLAASHKEARLLGLDEIFNRLNEEFYLAKRPLNYISDNYLKFKKQNIFPTFKPN